MNVKKEIIDSIETIVDSIVKRKCPVITFGIVTEIENNKCSVRVNNIEYKMNYYGGHPVINIKYPVFIPYGNMSQAFIIV